MLRGFYQTKTHGDIFTGGWSHESLGASAVSSITDAAASSNHSVFAQFGAYGICYRFQGKLGIPIRTPFLYISQHVVQSPWVGLFHGNRAGGAAGIVSIPGELTQFSFIFSEMITGKWCRPCRRIPIPPQWATCIYLFLPFCSNGR